MSEDVPVEQRFSHVYAERGKPTAESARMRFRLFELVTDYLDPTDVAGLLRREIELEVE